ncbi:cyclin-dependent kinase 4 inhibitor D [Latimeria chalumnae]|uniref:Cyclin-dependent kinase 4 inhibitor D n=1 Tax=Latimeria chalumnae TaxID=7897 RepID=H3B1A5_LATCH|nr:PREDICTED: cyclin-dependent kinase 4 inhibitor D [Latimeria chalumnae]|eukprot:XP_005994187.1 PREDICTED: cyclin-dependent kinase 4 inhibitor D [Latimeria chalumnae]
MILAAVVSDGDRLSTASATGKLAEVRRLLNEELVPADVLNQFGKTALQAMMFGNHFIAEELLKCGADPNVQDAHGNTPAHDAVRTGFLETLQVLVENGANVNLPDGGGSLPIHLAVREHREDMVKYLAPKSNLRHKDSWGQTPLELAAASGCAAIRNLLEQQMQKNLY